MKKTETKREITKKEKIKLSGIIVAVLALGMLIKGAMLQPQIIDNQDTIAELESRKAYEQQRGEEIDNMKENVDTDEYIEKIAREKLGMIRKDEIIFIDVNGEQ